MFIDNEQNFVSQAIFSAIDTTKWMDTPNITNIIIQYLEYCKDHHMFQNDGDCYGCYQDEMKSLARDYYDMVMDTDEEEE